MNRKQLREKASRLPELPGVYLWLDTSGKAIYIGKAKNLRNRVLSYFREDGDGRLQLHWLMSQAVDIDYIVTGSEIEALVTEANLARSKKPKFNVRLKDDKSYPYIKITREEIPRIFLTRSVKDDGSRYLGPYTDVAAVRRMLELVHAIFPLRLCGQKLPSGILKRACLNYQIKKCSGPCVGYISMPEYRRYVEDAVRFIEGHNEALVRNLEERMVSASESMRFEEAAELRDRIDALRKVSERRRAFGTSLLTGDWDSINFFIMDTEATFVLMEIREGKMLGKKDYTVSGVQYSSVSEMTGAFLAQYYLRASIIPPEIHLPEIPADERDLQVLLSERRGGRVQFVYPKRGEKARFLEIARTNAEHIMRQTREKRDRMKNAVPAVLEALKRDLKLPVSPRWIVCMDISHLHGTDTVGSLVSFRDGRPAKEQYRHFRIRTVEGIDDFKSMREIVERYFSRILKEQGALPDLLLVDGGKGQLSSALEVLKALGIENLAVAGLAKRLEEIYLPGAPDPQNIPKTSSSLHLLQRIRDEAHRFAVTYQRKLRKKRTISSALTQIEGIGPSRSRALLRHFGSLAELKKAPVGEISKVPGIGEARAKIIHAALHNENEVPSQTP